MRSTDKKSFAIREKIVGERFAAWRNELRDWGFEQLDRATRLRQPGEFVTEGVYPESAGVPGLQVSVAELWMPGKDPNHLPGAEYGGGYLQSASWHAQFFGIEEMTLSEGSLRLDLDRSKPRALWVHEHPFRQPNDHREGRAGVPSLGEWIHEVLALRADLVPID